MPTIPIDLGERSYNIHVGSGILRNAAGLLKGAGVSGLPLFVVTDEQVAAAQPAALEAFKQEAGARSTVEIVPAGEGSKSMAGFSSLLDRLVEFERGEGAIVAAFGGGVVGDLSGFVAACYKRGIPWMQVPTTLLAQVDASVGGKVAINHPSAKNLIGAFHQPRLVLADTNLLRTLPARDLRSGLAEVIKHGVIADTGFFDRIEETIEGGLKLEQAVMEDYVATSCRIKGAAVVADERDTTGRRASLNYGHTFGHAIELAGHFRCTHGEAIAIGMACAGDLAVRLGLLCSAEAARIEALIQRAGLPTSAEGMSTTNILAAMKLDKKAQNGMLRFILADRIGAVRLHREIPEALVQEVLKQRVRQGDAG